MTTCPVCLGDGGVDLRDSNAVLTEHLTDAELACIPSRHLDWWECDECEGSGVVDEQRARDIEAWAAARVAQTLADFARRGLA